MEMCWRVDSFLHLFLAALSIVVIDLTLSGDNAIVIGMAAHRLPPKQRRIAIFFGAAGAIVLRVTFAALATYLLMVPLLRAVGGAVLIWIASKLLRQQVDEETGGHREANTLVEAIRIIVLADVVMSLDNILAVGGAAHGSVALLAFGLLMSMPLIMLGSGLLASIMSKLGWLVYVGAGVLAWTSAQMILEDDIVGKYLPQGELSVVVGTLLIGAILGVLWLRDRSGRPVTHSSAAVTAEPAEGSEPTFRESLPVDR